MNVGHLITKRSILCPEKTAIIFEGEMLSKRQDQKGRFKRDGHRKEVRR